MGLIKQRDQKRMGPVDLSLLKDDLSRRETGLPKASRATRKSKVCTEVQSSCNTCSSIHGIH